MNKNLLIISPYFPPINAADSHRVRMSLPYYKQFGWDAEIVTIDPDCTNMLLDDLLCQGLPIDVKIHYVKAWNKRYTSKVGLGSVALRSIWFYFKTVNILLKQQHYDLLFFSTTQFPVLVLGAYWKWKYKVKIAYDLQDPWHTDQYKAKPKNQRPPKYWFSYLLNKYLEPIAMNAADGLISVADGYVQTIHERYKHLKNRPFRVIPFGMHTQDIQIAMHNMERHPSILTHSGKLNIVYIGRGGYDLLPAFELLLQSIRSGLRYKPHLFNKIHIHLIGTSYAPFGTGKSTFRESIGKYGLTEKVTEITDRIPFYQAINTLRDADLLFLPGPDQPDYTASKIFPYIMAQKPILAIVHPKSSATGMLQNASEKLILTHNQPKARIKANIIAYIEAVQNQSKNIVPIYMDALAKHSSASYTQAQTKLFDLICNVAQ
jgi:glycosyltransferase involved in cell wall biosynthesis